MDTTLIWCHMEFYVMVVTTLLTTLMNHSTSIVILTCFQSIQMPIIETKFGILYILICEARNRHHNDLCLEEIGLHPQNLLITLHSIGNDMRQ